MTLLTVLVLSVSQTQPATVAVPAINRAQVQSIVTQILDAYPEVVALANAEGVTPASVAEDRRPPSLTSDGGSVRLFTKAGIDFSVSTRTGRVHALSIISLPPENDTTFTADQEISRIQRIWNAVGYPGTLRIGWERREPNRLRADFQPVIEGAEFPVDAPVSVAFHRKSRVPKTIWFSGVPPLNVETSPLATDTQVEQAVATNAFPESGFSAIHLTLGEPFYSRWSEMSLGKTQFTPDDLAIRQEGKAVLIRQVIMADVGSYNPATQEFARWQVVYVRAKTGRVMARIDYAGMSGGQTPGVKGKRPVFNPRQVSFGDFRGSLTPMQNVKFASKPESVTIRSGGGLWRAEYEASSGLVRLVQGDLWFRR